MPRDTRTPSRRWSRLITSCWRTAPPCRSSASTPRRRGLDHPQPDAGVGTRGRRRPGRGRGEAGRQRPQRALLRTALPRRLPRRVPRRHGAPHRPRLHPGRRPLDDVRAAGQPGGQQLLPDPGAGGPERRGVHEPDAGLFRRRRDGSSPSAHGHGMGDVPGEPPPHPRAVRTGVGAADLHHRERVGVARHRVGGRRGARPGAGGLPPRASRSRGRRHRERGRRPWLLRVVTPRQLRVGLRLREALRHRARRLRHPGAHREGLGPEYARIIAAHHSR